MMPEVDQVRDLVDEARIRPAPPGCHARAGIGGEARDVGLVDDRVAERALDPLVALPVVVAPIDDDALHRDRAVGRVAGVDPSVARRCRDRPPVWIEEHLRRVEPQAVVRRPRPVHAVAVQLAVTEARDVDVPVGTGPVADRVEDHDPCRDDVVDAVEQDELDPAGVLGEDREVDAVAGDRRPQPVVASRRDRAVRGGRDVAVGRQVWQRGRGGHGLEPDARLHHAAVDDDGGGGAVRGAVRGEERHERWRSPAARRRVRAGWRSRAWPWRPGRTG